MRTFFIGFLILAAVLVGGSVVANVAYQAGVQTAVTTVAATAPEGTVVTPVVPAAVPGYPYYGYGYGPGWGWHGGFSIFGFLIGLFFLFLLFGLLRAAFGRGRGWGGPGGGWGYRGGPGGWSNHDHNGDRPWERQARELHDSWHRENPGEPGGPGGSGGTGAAANTTPTDRPSTGGSTT